MGLVIISLMEHGDRRGSFALQEVKSLEPFWYSAHIVLTNKSRHTHGMTTTDKIGGALMAHPSLKNQIKTLSQIGSTEVGHRPYCIKVCKHIFLG